MSVGFFIGIVIFSLVVVGVAHAIESRTEFKRATKMIEHAFLALGAAGAIGAAVANIITSQTAPRSDQGATTPTETPRVTSNPAPSPATAQNGVAPSYGNINIVAGDQINASGEATVNHRVETRDPAVQVIDLPMQERSGGTPAAPPQAAPTVPQDALPVCPQFAGLQGIDSDCAARLYQEYHCVIPHECMVLQNNDMSRAARLACAIARAPRHT